MATPVLNREITNWKCACLKGGVENDVSFDIFRRAVDWKWSFYLIYYVEYVGDRIPKFRGALLS